MITDRKETDKGWANKATEAIATCCGHTIEHSQAPSAADLEKEVTALWPDPVPCYSVHRMALSYFWSQVDWDDLWDSLVKERVTHEEGIPYVDGDGFWWVRTPDGPAGPFDSEEEADAAYEG
jgi:hypothetical protein